MRVLVAGATGVLGRPAAAALRAAGHEVTGFSRRGDAAGDVRAVDALDAEAVAALVAEVRPEVVVNLLTAIPAEIHPRKIGELFLPTNQLRTQGTRNLLAAAPDARHVAESVAFIYDPAPGLAAEDDPCWQGPPSTFVAILDAVLELEQAVLGAGGTVLRLGYLHGPGTSFAPDGSFTRQIVKRQLPLAGPSTGVLSFVHTDDAARAVVAAVDRGVSGVFNVVEDDPRPVCDWLPELAASLGAKRPRRVPLFLVRLIAGGYGVAFFNDLRGADNAKAQRELGWTPTHRFPV